MPSLAPFIHFTFFISIVGIAVAQTANKVDDRDPGIKYTPGTAWQLGGQADEYSSTTTWTQEPFAQISYSFQGTSIRAYGTLDGTVDVGTGLSTFSIDGGPAQSFDAKVSSGVRTPGQVLASAANLENIQHTIVITNGGPGPVKYILDYFEYVSEPIVASTSGNTAPTPSNSSSLPGLVTVTLTSVASGLSVTGSQSLTVPATTSTGSTVAPPYQNNSNNPIIPSNLVPIVGGAAGGAALIILLAVAYFIYRRRRRNRPIPPSPLLDMERKSTTHGPSDHSTTHLPSSPSILPLMHHHHHHHQPSSSIAPTPSPSVGQSSLSSQQVSSAPLTKHVASPLPYDTSPLIYLETGGLPSKAPPPPVLHHYTGSQPAPDYYAVTKV